MAGKNWQIEGRYAKGLGAIKFDLNGPHSSLAHIAWNQNDLLHSYDEYKLKFDRP